MAQKRLDSYESEFVRKSLGSNAWKERRDGIRTEDDSPQSCRRWTDGKYSLVANRNGPLIRSGALLGCERSSCQENASERAGCGPPLHDLPRGGLICVVVFQGPAVWPLGRAISGARPWLEAAGLALTYTGTALAIWARWSLGGNWSAGLA